MPFRIIKSLLFVALLVAVVYVFYHNQAHGEVFYKKEASLKGPMGLILLASFAVGALCTLFLSLLVGIKLKFNNWKTIKEKDVIEQNLSHIDTARGHLALGNFEKARAMFQKIISKNPSNIGARAFLAKTFKDEGDLKQALKVLDEARSEDKKSTELLLLAADINAELGNHTAAYDNAAMVLKLVPKNKFALEKLSRDCLALNRYEEAITYQRQLIKLSNPSEVETRQQELANLELEKALKENAGDEENLEIELKSFLKRHRNYPPALSLMASMQAKDAKTKDANKNWHKAFVASGTISYLADMSKMWITAGDQEKAISSVTSAVNDFKGTETKKGFAELFLVKLLLHLGHTDQAKLTFSEVEEIKDPALDTTKSIIRAKFLEKEGNLDSAFGELVSLFESEPIPMQMINGDQAPDTASKAA